jgi:hypothetical protein
MKVLIILLLLVILIYLIYLKKENFEGMKVTPEMRARMTQEQIHKLQDSGLRTITHTAYMEFETQNNLQRFDDLMGDYETKFNFVQDFKDGLGFNVREQFLPNLFNILDGEKKYRHYLGFKDSKNKLGNLGAEYTNPNNYDYSTLFVEKFKPNVTLTTLFKLKNDNPIRLRYEIKRGDEVLFSNYIYYENQTVDKLENDKIKLIKSTMSKRYEPHSNLLIGGDFRYATDKEDDRSFSDYFRDLHKLVIDLKNCSSEKDYNDLKKNYDEGEYKFAFEDFDRIDMNIPYNFLGNTTVVEKVNDKLELNEIKAINDDDEKYDGIYNLFFDENCREVKSNLYLPPGDDYSLVFICEKTALGELDKNDILINLEHNFSLSTSPIEKVVVNNSGDPLSYLNFDDTEKYDGNPDGNPDGKHFLKLNTSQYKDEYNKIEYITKNPNQEDTDNPFLVKNDIEPLEPGRYYKYVNLILFKVLLKFRKNMSDEEYNDDQKERFEELQNGLLFFLNNYLLERNDERILKNPSNRYKLLEEEIERLFSLPPTEENETLLGLKQNELDELRIIELNVKQPFGPYQEKIDNLKNIYNQIIRDYNGNDDEMKKFLMSNKILNQSGNPSFESLIEKYIAKNLLNNVNETLNPIKTLECMNNLLALINSLEPDGDGIVSNSQMSELTIKEKFPECLYKYYPFKIEVKEEPAIEYDIPEEVDAIEPPADPPDVSRFTEIMREVITLVKRDFRKIVKMKRYESLDPELESILKSIKRASVSGKKEEIVKIKKMIKLIVNLIEKIKDGSIDDINDLIELDTESYVFPNEVLVETFSNINIMRPLQENFIGDVDLHKHTDDGRINFGLDWGNPLDKTNQGRYDEYGLLSEQSKSDVLSGYNKVNNVLEKADGIITRFSNQIEEKVNKVDFDKIDKATNKSIEQIEQTQDDMDKLYLDTETNQNEKIARITEKVQELEKLQNKKYLGDMDSYNAVKSFGDGQIISVQNMKKDIYSILVNKQCLQYDKKNNLSLGECDNNKSQRFKLNLVNDRQGYNNLVVPNGNEPVTEFDSVAFPFNTLNPILHKSQCLTLNGNSIGVKECVNNNKQRWEGLKNIKLCDNFNMN